MSTVRDETLRFDDVAVGDALPELAIPLDPDPDRGDGHRLA